MGPRWIYLLTSLVEGYGAECDGHAKSHGSVPHDRKALLCDPSLHSTRLVYILLSASIYY